MLIACKFEEIYAPEVRDFVYISDEVIFVFLGWKAIAAASRQPIK